MLLVDPPTSSVNPEVWDTRVPVVARHHPPVLIWLRDPTCFPALPQFPLSTRNLRGLKPIIDRLMGQGLLIPTTSPCNTPILPVRKVSGDHWLVQDLRPNPQYPPHRTKGSLFLSQPCLFSPTSQTDHICCPPLLPNMCFHLSSRRTPTPTGDSPAKGTYTQAGLADRLHPHAQTSNLPLSAGLGGHLFRMGGGLPHRPRRQRRWQRS